MRILFILFGLVRMALNPKDYTRVEKFRAIIRRYGYFKTGVETVKAHPDTKAIIMEKSMIIWDMNTVTRLKRLPPNTLGYQFVTFIERHGLDFLSYSGDKNVSDEEYFIRRVVQTHDLWHVVLGYGPDELGEIEINSFMLAQFFWPPAGFYIGGYILRQMLVAPNKVTDVVRVVAKGWARGKATKPLFAVRWETQLERSLEDIRAELDGRPLQTSAEIHWS